MLDFVFEQKREREKIRIFTYENALFVLIEVFILYDCFIRRQLHSSRTLVKRTVLTPYVGSGYREGTRWEGVTRFRLSTKSKT